MYELITGVSMHIPNLYRDNSSFPYAPHLCRDSNLCQDKSQNHIYIFQIYIGAFYLFRDRIIWGWGYITLTLNPNLCRDRVVMPNPNLCRDSDLCGDKTQKYTHIFLIYIGIVLYFTLAPNLCRDRNLYRYKTQYHTFIFLIYVGIGTYIGMKYSIIHTYS